MASCEHCIYRNTEDCIDRLSSVGQCYQPAYTMEQLQEFAEELLEMSEDFNNKATKLLEIIGGLQ